MAPRQLPDPKSSLREAVAYMLRFLRESHGETGTQVGRVIGVERSEVSKLEYGDHALNADQAALLDTHWNTGGILSILVHFARLGHNPSWVGEHIQQLQRALVIRTYQGSLIPGLFQTEAYIRAGLEDAGVDDIDRKTKIRTDRQSILFRPEPPRIWALIDQNALDRPAGGKEVMREQLLHLLELMDRRNITIRIVPRSVGFHPGLPGAFTILTLPDTDVGFMESLRDGRQIFDRVEVRWLLGTYEDISARALPSGTTRTMIERFAQEMT